MKCNVKRLCIMCMVLGIFLSGCHMNYNLELDRNNPEDKLYLGISGTGNLEMTKEAVEAGADINTFHRKELREHIWHYDRSQNPMMIAMFGGNYEGVEYLLECSADVNYQNENGRAILSYCAESGNTEYIAKLLEKGADINCVDKKDYTALDYAVESRRVDAVRLLLEHTPIITDDTFKIVLDNLYEDSSEEVHYWLLKSLIEADRSIEMEEDIKKAFLGDNTAVLAYLESEPERNEKYDIIASAAAAFCGTECMEYLLGQPDIESVLSREHFFRMASMFGNVAMMQYLVGCGAEINARNEADYSAVELAVLYDRMDAVQLLQEMGADFHPSTSNNERDALYNAVGNSNLEMVKLLLSHPGYFNTTQATFLAIRTHQMDILVYFLDMGVELNTNNWAGCNLLGEAVLSNDIEILKYLVERGAEINDKNCENPVCYCAETGNAEMMQYLIDHGADINSVMVAGDGSKGDPAILKAITRGQFEALKVLVENGADIYIDFYGRTIVEYAQVQGSENIYNYVKQIYEG